MSKRPAKQVSKKAPKQDEMNDDEIAEALGLDITPKEKPRLGAHEARILAGFEEIVAFVEEQGRPPELRADRDIFERMYAVRLARIRGDAAMRALVSGLDRHGLLADDAAATAKAEPLAANDIDAAWAELAGLDAAVADGADITVLRHVRPRADSGLDMAPPPAAEDVARRKPCAEFARYRPLFAKLGAELDAGHKETARFTSTAEVKEGDFFVVGGQLAYVAKQEEQERRKKERRLDRRLRVIYDNGTESDLLQSSLRRALNKDEAGRRIIDVSNGPLFARGEATEDDVETGTIYVLRSHSTHPFIAGHRELVHKIGVTRGEVEVRVVGAADDPTFLFAEVEVVASYKLYNINRSKLENLLHRFLAAARLAIDIPDRFGQMVRPREWFLVPLDIIDQAIERVRDGSLARWRYDPTKGVIVKA